MKDRFIQVWNDHRNDIWLAIGVTLVTFLSFGLGRLALPQEKPLPIQIESLPAAVTGSTPENAVNKNYVASKNGTKYYLPTCSGASRIKEENRVWFVSQDEAEEAGYEPAANCPGLTP